MRTVAPPTGQQPPAQLALGDGAVVDLGPPASAAADRHLARHPEELERYGPHARAWCRHDLQWVLCWALQDADGQPVDLLAQVDWLARVLAARDYPLDPLADALDGLAEVVDAEWPAAAVRLREGAARVRPGSP